MKLSKKTVHNLLTLMSQRTDHPHDAWETVANYGEPGYDLTIHEGQPDTAMVVLGYYWCRDSEGLLGAVDDHYHRVWFQMEAQGVSFEWSDEWTTDDDNKRAYRTSPDSYGWTPSYIMTENGIITRDDPKKIIDWATNDPHRCIPLMFQGDERVNDDLLAEYGFMKVNENPYQNGIGFGMDDDPKKIIRDLEQANLPDRKFDYVFIQTEMSQFYMKFDLYIRGNRDCLAGGHWGHDGQVEAAVENLTDDEKVLFDQAFPQYMTWREDHYTDAVDPEFSSWVADWIEANTNMYWDDGELWVQDNIIIPDSVKNA